MSGDNTTPDDAAFGSQLPEEVNELSDEELDEVSGGFDMHLTVQRFHRSRFSGSRGAGYSRGHSAGAAYQAETIESAQIEMIILDATTEDLKALGSLFRNASAIEGSDD
ncbi:bacteriocin [Pseudanabaenaceae cyanobacterium LEGE 13415]|nr:bacteriocin [Pseudanabaenaceae cyanobacterium LEGE 13415]